MFPPEPTKSPQVLTQNLWGSLKRAADGHWGDEATVNPDGTGFKITLRLAQKLEPPIWEIASKYIRRYARGSHWKVTKLAHRRGYIEMLAEYSPPKPKKKWNGHRLRRLPGLGKKKTEAKTPQDQGGGHNRQP
jgi:hypothetical protein